MGRQGNIVPTPAIAPDVAPSARGDSDQSIPVPIPPAREPRDRQALPSSSTQSVHEPEVMNPRYADPISSSEPQLYEEVARQYRVNRNSVRTVSESHFYDEQVQLQATEKYGPLIGQLQAT